MENKYVFDVTGTFLDIIPEGSVIVRDVNSIYLSSNAINSFSSSHQLVFIVESRYEAINIFCEMQKAAGERFHFNDMGEVENAGGLYKFISFSFQFNVPNQSSKKLINGKFIIPNKLEDSSKDLQQNYNLGSCYSTIVNNGSKKELHMVGTTYPEHSIDSLREQLNKCELSIDSDKLTYETIFLDIHRYVQELKKLINSSDNKDSNSTKEQPMNTKISFTDRLKNNAIEGAYQGAARVAIDTFIEAIVFTMKKSGVDESSIMLATAFLKSDIGTAIVSGAIGASVPYVPVDVMNNPVVEKIADKCVQNAVADTGQLMAEVALKYVKPALEAAANSFNKVSVPSFIEAPKVRVNNEPKETSTVEKHTIDDLSDEEILMLIQKRREGQAATRLH